MIHLPYSSVFPSAPPPTWRLAASYLRHYSLGQVLEATTALGIALANDPEPFSVRFQRDLISKLFRNSTRAIGNAAEALRLETGSTIAVFEPLGLLNVAKLALLTLPVSNTQGTQSLEQLGLAMLMLYDLAGSGPVGQNPVPGHSLPSCAWLRHLVANSAFHASEPAQKAIGRSLSLYLTDRPQLHGRPEYVDLHKVLMNVTGLTPDGFLAIAFSMLVRWITFDPSHLGTTSIAFPRDQWFAKYDFTSAELNRFFGLFTIDAATLKTQATREYSTARFKQFDYLPFAKRPLVDLDGGITCPTFVLTSRRLARDWYHIFVRSNRIATADRFMTYLGLVFHEYVRELLIRTFGVAAVVDLDTLPPRQGRAVCDFCVADGDALILIECKSHHLDRASRTDVEGSAFAEKLRELFVTPLRQLSETADDILAERIPRPASMTTAPDQILPLVVQLDQVPIQSSIYAVVENRRRRYGWLMTPTVRPVQFMCIDELEGVELAVGRGNRAADLIGKKLSLRDGAWMPFKNYWAATSEDATFGTSPELDRLYSEVMSRAQSWMRSREKKAGSA